VVLVNKVTTVLDRLLYEPRLKPTLLLESLLLRRVTFAQRDTIVPKTAPHQPLVMAVSTAITLTHSHWILLNNVRPATTVPVNQFRLLLTVFFLLCRVTHMMVPVTFVRQESFVGCSHLHHLSVRLALLFHI